MAVKTSTAGAAHSAGIFADMTLDGPEIGTLVAVIDRARHLPNRKTMGKQDPYCALRLGKEAKKTETDRRGGQTPKWDQELRFTVHDSPDYYRMKCSVFNDDKKTEMIGEAWIDLKEVIVSGGGQNDLWHQLFFKGKNAGEIRIEMTYYDSRPQEEAMLEKKREKERRQIARQGSAQATATGPRQLAPRDVKRRPLPPNPDSGSQSPAAGPLTSEPSLPQFSQPQRSGGYDGDLPAKYPSAEREFVHNDEFQEEYNMKQNLNLVAVAPACYQSRLSSVDMSYDEQTYSDDSRRYDELQDGFYISEQNSSEVVNPDGQYAPSQASHRPGLEDPSWIDSPTPFTSRSHQSYSPQSMASSPPNWPSPLSAPSNSQSSDSRSLAAQNRHSISPAKFNQYRDSPLRQSMTQYDANLGHCVGPHDSNEQQAPPPPPIHRTSIGPAAPVRPSAHQQRIPQPTPNERASPYYHSPLDARSPLQTLERNYDSTYQSQPSPLSPLTPSQYPRNVDSRSLVCGRSPDYYNYNTPSPQQGAEFVASQGDGHFESYHSDEPMSYDSDPRRLSNACSDMHESPDPYGGRGRPPQQRMSLQEEPQVYRSQVPLVRPRPISPDVRGMPQRKSISPHPASEEDRITIPWSPDSYDAPNTGSSPAPQLESPEQMREVERQREVDKLRDQGPIIGNDGRVIDPSDHLPADTWAPIYQKPTRKPEHVIRFKTKEQTPRGGRTGSSPSSVRPLSVSTSPLASPSTQPAVSAAVISPSKDGRNRLQKQMPARPLPTQHFQHSQSSPAISTTNSPAQSDYESLHSVKPGLPQHRHWTSPSPQSGISRQSISDYSLKNMHGQDDNQNVKSAYGATRAPPIPRKEPLYTSPQQPDYSPRGSANLHARGPLGSRHEDYILTQADTYDPRFSGGMSVDPLSAELSMIDIGPSRNGRTAARFSRGY